MSNRGIEDNFLQFQYESSNTLTKTENGSVSKGLFFQFIINKHIFRLKFRDKIIKMNIKDIQMNLPN